MAGSRDIRICSWPSARPPADIELRSEGSVALDDASGQPPGRGQLPGCRVELHVRQLTIVDRCGTEQAESDTVSGLLHWTASSQAAIVVLDSDEDTFSLFDGDDGCLTVNIRTRWPCCQHAPIYGKGCRQQCERPAASAAVGPSIWSQLRSRR